eukprot:556870-Pyramimonas_sp.AAC.2
MSFEFKGAEERMQGPPESQRQFEDARMQGWGPGGPRWSSGTAPNMNVRQEGNDRLRTQRKTRKDTRKTDA